MSPYCHASAGIRGPVDSRSSDLPPPEDRVRKRCCSGQTLNGSCARRSSSQVAPARCANKVPNAGPSQIVKKPGRMAVRPVGITSVPLQLQHFADLANEWNHARPIVFGRAGLQPDKPFLQINLRPTEGRNFALSASGPVCECDERLDRLRVGGTHRHKLLMLEEPLSNVVFLEFLRRRSSDLVLTTRSTPRSWRSRPPFPSSPRASGS